MVSWLMVVKVVQARAPPRELYKTMGAEHPAQSGEVSAVNEYVNITGRSARVTW
jgi:hypothetical protein